MNKTFFDHLRLSGMLGKTLEQSEVDGVNEILEACQDANWPVSFTAYALATALHETAGTMQPIKERGGAAYFERLYDVCGLNPARARRYGNMEPGDGARYCGRGYVQLTWKNNYERAGNALALDLAEMPDLAMEPDVAAKIMVRGMQEGWFTGRDLDDYLPTKGPANEGDFIAARRIINGRDRAEDIARYALQFQDALIAADWQTQSNHQKEA